MSNKASTSTKQKKKVTFQTAPVGEEEEEEEGASSAKNEGIDLNWAYKPPPGVKAITTNEDNGEFDWDAVHNNEDVEIWVMRVPDTIKSKHLEGLSFDLSASETISRNDKRKTSRISTFNQKQTLYDVWSLGDDDHNTKTSDLGHGQLMMIGGEELESISCLLPRKNKKGALYPSPKPIARRLIVSARPPEPTSTSSNMSSTESTPLLPNTNPPRHKYPPERLTHRFMPYGSLINPNYVPSSDKTDEKQSPPNPNPNPNASPKTPAMEVDEVLEMTIHEDREEEEGEEDKQKTKKTTGKKKEKAKPSVEVVINVATEKAQAESKVEKEKKGKKRKGVDQEDTKGSQKKPKKAKIAS